ncbi:hypothetical protein JZ751_009694 [Albula glossodonta]|uniref:2-hydroxyacyl-CoA lyase n=1 Tax=Albula glossodonta TaxID=121402 RepID=A0A8T2P1B8_9TELE|nr:hypothetical protein JZ751_009694 [Albula glossodonta]
MGVGPGFAIAAAALERDRGSGQRVVCIEGDSAFGFSGMEVETMCRYKLPIIIIVVNNNGIYSGVDTDTWREMGKMGDLTTVAPPVTLLPDARYDEVMAAFGGRGFLVQTPEELRSALTLSLEDWEGPRVSLADPLKLIDPREEASLWRSLKRRSLLRPRCCKQECHEDPTSACAVSALVTWQAVSLFSHRSC